MIYAFSHSHLLNYGVVNVEIPLYLPASFCSVCTLVSLWLLGPMLTPSITPVPVMFRAQQDMAVDRCAHIIASVLSAPPPPPAAIKSRLSVHAAVIAAELIQYVVQYRIFC